MLFTVSERQWQNSSINIDIVGIELHKLTEQQLSEMSVYTDTKPIQDQGNKRRKRNESMSYDIIYSLSINLSYFHFNRVTISCRRTKGEKSKTVICMVSFLLLLLLFLHSSLFPLSFFICRFKMFRGTYPIKIFSYKARKVNLILWYCV